MLLVSDRFNCSLIIFWSADTYLLYYYELPDLFYFLNSADAIPLPPASDVVSDCKIPLNKSRISSDKTIDITYWASV